MVQRRPRAKTKTHQVHFQLEIERHERFVRAAAVMGVTLSHFASIAIESLAVKTLRNEPVR
jgi:hypothetical protein